MSECKKCIHKSVCKKAEYIENYKIQGECSEFVDKDRVIELPCKVGDKFYKIEKWCTEGGYWDKPRYAYSSTCEDCCEECDGKTEIIEYTFHSAQQILSLERTFGQYVFLTKEEAEQALSKLQASCEQVTRKEDEGK